MNGDMSRCEACSLPLSDDPELWHSIHPRIDLPDATEANEWAQDHQGDYHPACCPLCSLKGGREDVR